MDNQKEITTFNMEKEYNTIIKPLVDQLMVECVKLDMPLFLTCCVKSTNEETTYKNTIASAPGSSQINLKTDTISRHIAVCRGFEVTPRKYQEDLDNDFLDYEL